MRVQGEWVGDYMLEGEEGGMGVSERIYWELFISMSDVGLRIFVKVSFICSFLLLKLYMWKCSRVLNKWPFLFICNISTVSF
jgi:hypothetical protein